MDRKQVDVSDSGGHVSHLVSIISANPKDGGKRKSSCTDGVINDNAGRVLTVWGEVRAGNKDLFGDAIRVRAQLTVIEEQH